MGLSLRPLGRRIWEAVTPVDEGAQRRADANLQRANQAAQQPAKYGVLRNQATRDQFISQNKPTGFSLGRATAQSINQAPGRTIKAFQYGTPRSLAGTAEGALGLVDLATPGAGTNRLTKLATRAGKNIDEAAMRAGVDPATYRVAQATTDAAQYLAPSVVAQGAATAAKSAGIVGKVGKALSSTAPLINKPGLKYLSKPTTAVNAAVAAVRSSGYRTARDQDVSAQTVAQDAATALAFGKGLDAVGNKIVSPITNKLSSVKQGSELKGLTAEKTALDKEIAQLRRSAPTPAAEKRLRQARKEQGFVDRRIQKVQQGGYVKLPGEDPDVTQRLMLDYMKDPTRKAPSSGLTGEGAQAPTQLSAKAKAKLMKKAKAKVSLKSNEAGGGVVDNSPVVKALNTPSKIDPNDPFGNKNLLTKIRNEAGSLVDDDAQMITLLKKIEKESGRKGLVDQWMFDSGNVRASSSIANAKLKNSQDFSGALKGLSKKDLNEFDAYIAARAELKNYDGLPTRRTPEQNAAIVQAGDAKFGERFTYMNNFYKKQAQDMYDGGLITKEQLQAYQASDDYVRIQRDMEDLVNTNFGGSRSRSIGTTTAGQKRIGSERDILSPTASAAKRTQQLQLEIQRNKAATNTINVLQEAGLARKVSDTKNKNTISRIVEGKREVYEVPGDIKKVIDNVSPYQLGVIARVVSAPTRLFRAGTTALSAPFTVTNYLRDQASSGLYSKSIIDTHNPKNIVQGLASAARDFAGESQHPLWKKFEEFSGDQTIFDELRNAQNTKRLLREVRKGEAGKLGNMVTQPIRTLEDLNSITEKATRFQNFKGIYEKTLKATGDEQEAIKAAVIAARQNSVDFQRGSSFTRAVNLFIPYFNAGVQGSRNVARSFRDRPVGTAMKSVGMIAMPSVALTAYNLSDPDRRAAYDSINEFEKEDNFIVVGPNPKQREDGSWEGIYKIPKPQGYRELTDPVRDMSEAFMKGESVEDVAGMFKDMLGGLTGPVDITDSKKLLGGFIPQAAKPWIQLGMNQDLYTGGKIVPDYMSEETNDPTKRAFKGTSGTARLIAKQLGVSPIQVERAITDVTGSLGRYGINASDNTLANAGVIPDEQIGGRSIADDFSRRLFEASGKLLDKNKSPGRLYYEDVKAVTQGLNKNELAAFNSLHPSKTNFLGEDIFDENKRITAYTRAGAYLNNPGTLEADRKLDQMQRERGKPGNPMFDLPNPLLTKVLLKATLPPGSKDPELSNLYKEPWYQDYQNARSKYYDSLKAEMAKTGKPMPKSTNPYPQTPANLQRAMDVYSSLPKGTGERSSWIKANPGLWQQMTAQWAQVDAWENKERVAMGLSPIEDETTASSGFGSKGGSGGSRASGYAGRSKVSVKGVVAKPTVKTKDPGKLKGAVKAVSPSKPKVGIKKSLV